MSKMHPVALPATLLTAWYIGRLFLCSVPSASSQEIKFDYQGKNYILNSDRPFVNPSVAPRDPILDVNIKDYDVPGGDTLRIRSYNGKIAGPTIRVRPGDQLKITLKNSIPATEPDVLIAKGKPRGPNTPQDANVTNLHTHGLSVSPMGDADDVFRKASPQQNIQYTFDIPKDHPPGTHWYHPHWHGSTAYQLCSGLSGALIVDPGDQGGLDDIPEIQAAMAEGREKILLFQSLTFSRTLLENGKLVVRRHDAYDIHPLPDQAKGKVQFPRIMINGVTGPVITMRPGEVQRWRCIHAGITKPLHLCLENRDDPKQLLDLHEFAVDGLPLGEIKRGPSVKLQPGNRSDVLVQAPPIPGEYLLITTIVSKVEHNRAIDDDSKTYLARVKIEGKPVTMNVPESATLKKYRLRSVSDKEIKARRELTFKSQGEGNHVFKIGGKDAPWQRFDHGSTNLTTKLGTAEEWILRSEGGNHPFHIHVNPFEVLEKNDKGEIVNRVWKDTVLVAKGKPVTIRIRFERFTGKTVLHCHNLDHEDQGMMMVVNIVGPGGQPKQQGGLPALPAPGPAWKLADRANKQHRLADFAGRDVVLLFVRSIGCTHCRTQLDAFAKRQPDFAAAKLAVVAICPDTREEIAQALDQMPPGERPSLLLLADPSLQSFKKYGCHDNRLLHGTFVINADGMIRWQDVGDEPFMDIDALLQAHQKRTGRLQP